MKRKLKARRVRKNSETRAELQWEWSGVDPAEIPGPDDIEDWMAGAGPNRR